MILGLGTKSRARFPHGVANVVIWPSAEGSPTSTPEDIATKDAGIPGDIHFRTSPRPKKSQNTPVQQTAESALTWPTYPAAP